MKTSALMLSGAVLAFALVAPVSLQANTVTYNQEGKSLVFGTYNAGNPASSTQVPDNSVLAFPDVTLDDLADSTFLAYFAGAHVGRPAYALGKFPAFHTDANGKTDKIVSQFSIYDDAGVGNQFTKAVILELVNGAGGVYIRRIAARYRGGAYYDHCFFSMDEEGTVTFNQGAGGAYHLFGLQVLPTFVKTSPTKLWTGDDTADPITLNDLKHATFTARVGGLSLAAQADPVSAYNTRMTTDGQGNVTAINVEFQTLDDVWIKAIVVEFTNGGDGVYGTAKRACYVSTSDASLGYAFGNADGTYNGNSNSIATNPGANGYGVYGLSATVETERVWELDTDRNWSFFTEGIPLNDPDLTVRIRVTGDRPTLTIDEDTTIAKIVIENGLVEGVSTNTLAIDAFSIVSFGTLSLGPNAYVTIPESLSPPSIVMDVGSVAAYSGNVTIDSVISGAGGVEVAAGRVLFTASGSTFGGGLTVKAGATAVAGATYEIITATSASGPFGIFALNNAMGKVFIEEGGKVDLNGFNGLGYMFTLAGDDAYVNLGDPLNIGTSAVAANGRVPWQAYGWTLAADVALGATGTEVGIVSDNYNDSYLYRCMLDLGSHTLTKTGTGTLWFWTGELAVSGTGTLAINAGVLDIRKGMYNGASSTVTVGADTVLRLDAGMKVKSLVNNGTIDIVGSVDATIAGGYSGDGPVVKNGASAVAVPFNNGSKSVYTVNQGTLKVSGVTIADGLPYAFNTAETPNANQRVDVAEGAAFDLNGMANLSVCVRLAKNARFINSGGNISNGNLQTVQLTLDGDAEAEASGAFGLLSPGYNPSLLELGDHTLTLTGTNTFWLYTATITGSGSLVVSNGTLYVAGKADAVGEDAGVTVGEEGVLTLTRNMKVARFENQGIVDGSGSVTVTGTLTAGNAIPLLRLTDGATVKATGVGKEQVVTDALSATGSIVVDVSAISREEGKVAIRVPILIAPALPEDVKWKLYDPYVPGRMLLKSTGEGVTTLYLNALTGTLLMIR